MHAAARRQVPPCVRAHRSRPPARPAPRAQAARPPARERSAARRPRPAARRTDQPARRAKRPHDAAATSAGGSATSMRRPDGAQPERRSAARSAREPAQQPRSRPLARCASQPRSSSGFAAAHQQQRAAVRRSRTLPRRPPGGAARARSVRLPMAADGPRRAGHTSGRRRSARRRAQPQCGARAAHAPASSGGPSCSSSHCDNPSRPAAEPARRRILDPLPATAALHQADTGQRLQVARDGGLAVGECRSEVPRPKVARSAQSRSRAQPALGSAPRAARGARCSNLAIILTFAQIMQLLSLHGRQPGVSMRVPVGS